MFSLTILCMFVFLSLFCIAVSQNVPSSPCPNVFNYYYDNNGVYYGIFQVSPPYRSTLLIKVAMDFAGIRSSNSQGSIEIVNSSDVLRKIISGDNIQFKVNFPSAPILPVITLITFNGQEICNGPRVQALTRLSVELSHTLRTNIPNPYTGTNNYNNVQNTNNIPKYNNSVPQNYEVRPNNNNVNTWQNTFQPNNVFVNNPWPSVNEVNRRTTTTTSRPTTTTTTTTPRPPQRTTRRPILDNGSAICGIPKKVSNELVLRGDTTNKGDWPWLSALFLNEFGNLRFTCGGSLISREYVLTAGHCLLQRNYLPVSKEKFLVILGLYNIQDWIDEDARRASVKDVIFHPAFQSGTNLTNDIALLKLNNIVTFTDYIIPVCLWTSNLNILSITGHYGSVVGWGRDENGLRTTPEPRLTKQRVITTDQCRDYNPDYIRLTSDSTICAGNRNGTGPCNGDSGGGMFFRVGERWILRGVVSTTLSRPDDPNGCNLMDYVVYTDVAKYVPWINGYLL